MAEDSETSISASQGTGNGDTNQLWKIARYVEEVELYERETKTWDRQAKSILKRYKDDRGGDGNVESQERRFNVLWSNTQNLLPACYARNPKPDIQRRFKDADPIGRVSSDVLERCLSYYCDTDRFAATSRACVLDYLLPGRGTNWVRYDPHFKPAEEVTDDVGPGDANDQELAPEVLDYEDVISDYVHRDDFGHNICRTWDEVWCGWRKVYMTKRELKNRFRKPLIKKYGTTKADDMLDRWPMDYVQKDLTGKTLDDGIKKSIIYETWDKHRKIAVWFNKGEPDALDVRPDPLKLDGFFPFPKPLLANLTNDSLIPTPLYKEYQDQAAQLDELTNRIAQMTRALKVVGVYDASAEGLNRMFNEGTENELIPIQQWSVFAGEKGGMKGAMELLDISMIAQALLDAYSARDKVKEDLDEITGMSDIIRGATDANETASAQKLKAGFAGQRISDLQKDVQRFVRETIRIMTDVICNHFSDQTIKQISGVRLLTQQEKTAYQAAKQQAQTGQGAVQPPPLPPNVTPDQMEDMLNNPTWEEVFGLIRNNALRCFRIDIETDSTVKVDEQQEREEATALVTGIGSLLKDGLQAGAQDPDLIPVIGQILQFVTRRFSAGKEFESTLSTYIQKKEKEAQNPQPKPNPEMMKVQAEAQGRQQELQANMQLEQMKEQGAQARASAELNAKAQVAQAEANAKAATDQHLNEIEAQRHMVEINAENEKAAADAERQAALQRDQWAHEERLATLKASSDLEIAREKALIGKEQAIEVANINASAKVDVAGEARAEAQVDKEIGPVKDEALHAKIQQLTDAFNTMAKAQDGASKGANDNIERIHKALTAEKEIVRDPKTGKPTGVRIKPDNKALAKGLRN